MNRKTLRSFLCSPKFCHGARTLTTSALAYFALIGCAIGAETIRIHAVVTGDDVANGVSPPTFLPGWSAEDIDAAVDELSALYEHTGIKFEFDPATDLETINSTLLNNDYTGYEAPKVLDRLNAYARAKFAASRSGELVLFFRDGARQVATNFSGGHSNYVVLGKQAGSRSMLHEIGHLLHLSHTFPPGPNGDGLTMNEAIEAIRVYVEVKGHPEQDGLDAFADVDAPKVGDTPADIGIQIYRDLGRSWCESDPSIDLKVVFEDKSIGNNGHFTYTYNPDRTNPMSYFFNCQNVTPVFTEQQREVMRTALTKGNHTHLARGAQWNDGYWQALVTPAAVSRKADTIAVFATDDSGALASKVWDASRGTYWPSNNTWLDLGGGGLESPAVISRRPDLIDIVSTRMGSGANVVNKVWSEARDGYWPGNSTWANVSGSDDQAIGTIATASRSTSTLDLFARWIDGTVRAHSFAPSGWTTSEWVDMGGSGVSVPAAVTRLNTNEVELFARWSDGTIRKTLWRSPFTEMGTNKAWENLGGTGVDTPAVVARRSDIVDLFVRWDDGTIRSKVWTVQRQGWWPGQEAWLNLGGQATSKPVVVSRNASTILLATRWSDGTVRVKVWDDSRGSWWPSNTEWSNLGGSIDGAPVLVARGQDHLIMYARWTDGSIRSKVWNAGNSQWWPGQTSWLSLGRP